MASAFVNSISNNPFPSIWPFPSPPSSSHLQSTTESNLTYNLLLLTQKVRTSSFIYTTIPPSNTSFLQYHH
ncbi:Uncharacterized protein HZ326_2975 [Fusarium oxysporum f. sp. albedinis]|nr:Uncharacterized protein HZ326_2975 [Fusarium oxysporum f. sp. albedinis]